MEPCGRKESLRVLFGWYQNRVMIFLSLFPLPGSLQVNTVCSNMVRITCLSGTIFLIFWRIWRKKKFWNKINMSRFLFDFQKQNSRSLTPKIINSSLLSALWGGFIPSFLKWRMWSYVRDNVKLQNKNGTSPLHITLTKDILTYSIANMGIL